MKDVDFGRNEILIHDGKGFKDRATVLPQSLKAGLQLHLERVRAKHQKDLLGHKDVSTTQIYTHVMQRPGLGVRNPLDG